MEETRKQNGVTNIGGTDPTAVNREYKSDVFKMYFSIRKNALELYNALNGTDYTDEDALEINTLDQSVFLKIYNDVSFTISGTVNLYEHQSSVNPNMPLRDLFYVTDMFKSEIVNKDLHGKKLIKIPTPKFVVFYNGTGEMPDEEELKLSDAFLRGTDDPELELKVTVLNVNYGHNRALLDKCISLKHYSILMDRSRQNLNAGMSIEAAVTLAVDSCIKDHIMEDFLIRERAGVIAMHVLDFNEELHNKSLREEGREEGLKEGLKEGIEEGAKRERALMITRLSKNGKSAEEISMLLGVPLDNVKTVIANF